MTRMNFEIARSYVTAIAISLFTTGMLTLMSVAPAAGTGTVGII